MMGQDKKKITEGIVSKLVDGKEEYNTMPKENMAAELCAAELVKAIEAKDYKKIVAAFSALQNECSHYEDEEETEIEIKL